MQRSKICFCLGIALLFGCTDPEAKRAKRQQENQMRQEKIARADLEKWTKDPLAMQFRGLRQITQGICGEVNMKDDLGRYQGFMHFLDRVPKPPSRPNPSIANPHTVFSPKGTEDVLNLCMTETQRAAYQERYDTSAAAWERKTQEEIPKGTY